METRGYAIYRAIHLRLRQGLRRVPAASASSNFISEGEEGRAAFLCDLLESAHLGRHRDEPPARVQSPFTVHTVSSLELRGRTHALMYASMSSPLKPSRSYIMPNKPANGVLRTTDNRQEHTAYQHAYTGYGRFSNETTDRLRCPYRRTKERRTQKPP
jgi:hypothetical protein